MNTNIPPCSPVNPRAGKRKVEPKPAIKHKKRGMTKKVGNGALLVLGVITEGLLRTALGIAYAVLGALYAVPAVIITVPIYTLVFGSLDTAFKIGTFILLGGAVIGFICGFIGS